MWQAIILSANQCPKQSIVSIVNLANSSLSVIWQALKVAVSYLDSPEGLPAKQAAFLSGLPSSDYLTALANTKCPWAPTLTLSSHAVFLVHPLLSSLAPLFFAMYQPVLPRFYSGSEMREPSPICLSLSRSGPGSSHYVLSTICRFPR